MRDRVSSSADSRDAASISGEANTPLQGAPHGPGRTRTCVERVMTGICRDLALPSGSFVELGEVP
jgi:hypothetical protein